MHVMHIYSQVRLPFKLVTSSCVFSGGKNDVLEIEKEFSKVTRDMT